MPSNDTSTKQYTKQKSPSVTALAKTFLLICFTILLCLCKLLFVAKHECINNGVKINREELVGNS
jgi:hypothetical protein